MVRGTVTDALGGAPSVPSQGMSPHDVELSQYDPTAAADSAAGPSMQLRWVEYLPCCTDVKLLLSLCTVSVDFVVTLETQLTLVTPPK